MDGVTDKIKTSAALAALKSYKERPFVKHQWDELVMNLNRVNDAKLLELIGQDKDSRSKQH